MSILIPNEVEIALNLLYKSGFEAFIVGGCVRDSLLDKPVTDYDITTSALPNDILSVFNGYTTIETGIKHGTITVIINSLLIEITTYRVDGNYLDSRHPEKVNFTSSLEEDLARRDFTINAITYSKVCGIKDFFNGIDDLNNKTIRAIGSPDKRFNEDALRILRALRFASTLNFNIEEGTKISIHKNKDLLNNISKERIASEFTKLICGDNFYNILNEFSDVIAVFIPEITPMIGFNQNTPYHIYDVFTHTLHSMSHVENNPILRLSMLFHDIGKPHCYTEDVKHVGHFYGHAAYSSQITKDVLHRLKFDNDTIYKVYNLVKYHDSNIPCEKKVIKRWLNKFGEETMRNLVLVKKADNLAKAPKFSDRLIAIQKYNELINEIIVSNECFSLKNLAINGNDLIALGIPSGKQIGEYLNILLNAVIDGKCENTKKHLLIFLKTSFPELNYQDVE